jgi:hypothetical protein
MVRRIAIFLLPLAALVQLSAQTPPPGVDETLRARVTEFYQDHVDGKFTKAFEMVAEDTKDYYFGAGKVKFSSFKIDDVKYSDNFTKAVVTLTVDRILQVELKQVPVTTSGPTTWKIENGKWVWYRDLEVLPPTPMGFSNLGGSKVNPNGTPAMPKTITQESINDAARGILQQSTVSKSEVTLAADKPSSDEVIFHNGAPGVAQLNLDGASVLPGFHAELDKTTLNAGENATLKLRYEPASKEAKPLTLRLIVSPFNQEIAINVKFGPGRQQ